MTCWTSDWDVAPAESEGAFTKQAARDVEVAEAFFNTGGEGISHEAILKEFDLAR